MFIFTHPSCPKKESVCVIGLRAAVCLDKVLQENVAQVNTEVDTVYALTVRLIGMNRENQTQPGRVFHLNLIRHTFLFRAEYFFKGSLSISLLGC